MSAETENKTEVINEVNNCSIEQNKQEDQLNTFFLSPLEHILLNSKMPIGFKLETEENLVKTKETLIRSIPKKHKKTYSYIPVESSIISKRKNSSKQSNDDNDASQISVNNQKKSLRERKPIIKEDLGYIDKDIIKGKSNPMRATVSKQCEKGLMKIKRHAYADFFYLPQESDAPCLLNIEKNIRNFKYKSLYDFIMDLRKTWAYYFKHFDKNDEVFHKTSTMSENSENVYKELETTCQDKNEITEINKKIESMAKSIRDMKGNQSMGNGGGMVNNMNYNRKNDKYSTSINERPMTLQEKTALGNSIRQLNQMQMKEIIKILSDTIDMNNKKFLEFEIDTLSTRKLRELERFVKSCNKTKKESSNNNNSSHNNNENVNVQKLKSGLQAPNKNNANNMSHDANVNDRKGKAILNENDSISSSESDSSSLSSLRSYKH